jgi:predicted O-methyltransferase YrrM
MFKVVVVRFPILFVFFQKLVKFLGFSLKKKQEMQDYNYQCAKQRLTPFPDCQLIRKTSMEAVSDFADDSLDFVYIDGDHRFRYIAEDLCEWYLKVKPGGIISGDDYFCTSPTANNVLCHVKPVVDAFVITYQIPDFYIIGRQDKKPSWFIIKPKTTT